MLNCGVISGKAVVSVPPSLTFSYGWGLNWACSDSDCAVSPPRFPEPPQATSASW
jgi:hypothetical protein